MTIGAVRAHIFENQTRMAFGAGHLFVHAAQRITRAVVIELGIRPDRLPTCVGMAILARHGDGPVRIGYFGLRTAHTGSRAVRGLLYSSSSEQGYQSNQNRKEPARTYHRPLRVIQGPALGYDFVSSPFAYTNAGLPKDPWTAVKGSTSLARAVEVSQLAGCKFTGSQASGKLSSKYWFYRKLFCTALSASNWLNRGRGFPLTGHSVRKLLVVGNRCRGIIHCLNRPILGNFVSQITYLMTRVQITTGLKFGPREKITSACYS